MFDNLDKLLESALEPDLSIDSENVVSDNDSFAQANLIISVSEAEYELFNEGTRLYSDKDQKVNIIERVILFIRKILDSVYDFFSTMINKIMIKLKNYEGRLEKLSKKDFDTDGEIKFTPFNSIGFTRELETVVFDFTSIPQVIDKYIKDGKELNLRVDNVADKFDRRVLEQGISEDYLSHMFSDHLYKYVKLYYMSNYIDHDGRESKPQAIKYGSNDVKRSDIEYTFTYADVKKTIKLAESLIRNLKTIDGYKKNVKGYYTKKMDEAKKIEDNRHEIDSLRLKASIYSSVVSRSAILYRNIMSHSISDCLQILERLPSTKN